MSGYDVEPDVLQFAGMQLGDVAEELRTQAAPVRAQLDELLGTSWAGAAARGFEFGWRNWERGFDEVTGALADMGRLLSTTGQGYGTTEGSTTAGVEQSGGL